MERLIKCMIAWLAAASLGLAAGGAQAADVLLGPGDVVKASVYGSPDLAVETRVSERGTLTFRCWARCRLAA